jgi:TusA-related sulfurtransferase
MHGEIRRRDNGVRPRYAMLAMQSERIARHETLDVRGMQPPEPIERILTTIGDFKPGDTLTVVIDCEPIPLFRILKLNGFDYHSEPGTSSRYEISIRLADR